MRYHTLKVLLTFSFCEKWFFTFTFLTFCDIMFSRGENMFLSRLKNLRKNANLSQVEFAKKFNIANGTVGNWESGKRQPDQEMLTKIADYFDVSVDYLLGRTNTPKPTPLDEQLSGVDFAMWNEAKDMTDAEKQDIVNYMKFKKTQRNE